MFNSYIGTFERFPLVRGISSLSIFILFAISGKILIYVKINALHELLFPTCYLSIALSAMIRVKDVANNANLFFFLQNYIFYRINGNE